MTNNPFIISSVLTISKVGYRIFRGFSAPQLQSSLIWIHEILLFNTKTKMKLLLSMHPWVSSCTAELNMSPFSLLEEPRSLLFRSHPL